MLPMLELTQMQAELAKSLPDTCNLLARTNVSDGQGGMAQTWGTAVAGVDCRFDVGAGPRNLRELLEAAAVNPYARGIFTLPYNAVVTPAYRIEHGGYTYNVIGVNIDQSWPLCLRVDAERVNL